MTDFLLELRCEEIPARMQVKAADDLARLFGEELAKAGLAAGTVERFVTPRRLALIVRGLPEQTAAVSEEHKGPRTSAPPQALEGFLRKAGLTQDQLEDRGGVWFAVVNKPGRATRDVIAEAVPAVVRAFPWPKSMRWGAASRTTESLRWVRPLQGIVAILGEELVEIDVDGVRSGYATLGHRFHHPGEITIGGASDYVEKLRACHVIVDHGERMAIIEEKAREAAAARGLALVEDKGLVAENAGLTEWPVPLPGEFDPAFLEVPPEVIQLTLRTNQKYFVLRDGAGKLAPAFICVANIEAHDGGAAIVAGNRKVLAARLSDARFFWEQDKKTPLADHAKKLERITFHEKLGTVADKACWMERIARYISGKLDSDQESAALAARLSKADLVTDMVGEFPELQGIIGGYYAREEKLPDVVADAIQDHYKPVGQGDDVPRTQVSIAVALSDKLSTLGAFASISEWPTGSKDPYALRRAVQGIIRIIVENQLRLPVLEMADVVKMTINVDVDRARWLDFFADRLKVQQKEAGVRHDLIDAVFTLGGEDDLVRLLARVKALQSFVGTEDGANLLAGYKRAANILKKEGYEPGSVGGERSRDTDVPVGGPSTSLGTNGGGDVGTDRRADAGTNGSADVAANGRGDDAPEPAEAALIAALDGAEPRAAEAIAREDFEGAMAALASLRAPIDAFFDTVTVNDADPAKRAARLALLARVRRAVHGVADFSRIEG